MAYVPPPAPSLSQPEQRSLGSAIAIGLPVAIGCAFVVGLISGETNYEIAYASILLGWLVGVAIRRMRRGPDAAIAGALIALFGSALASAIALTLVAVKDAQVPLSFVLGNFSLVIKEIPTYIGWFGFVCWALAVIVAWSTVSGRGRVRRARGGQVGTAQGQVLYGPSQPPPYGQSQPPPYGQIQPPPYGQIQPPPYGQDSGPGGPPASPGGITPPPAG